MSKVQFCNNFTSMKYLKQFALILALSLVGELLNMYLPLPVPAGIYGMVLLFILLCLGVVKLPHVKQTADFLIEIMTISFIPAGVGLSTSWNVLKPVVWQVAGITVFTTFLIMVVAGRFCQFLQNRKGGLQDTPAGKTAPDTVKTEE